MAATLRPLGESRVARRHDNLAPHVQAIATEVFEVSPRVKETVRFLYAFLRSPKHVGSVIPSSSYLARAMVRPIDFSAAALIVELGAGTGVFTAKIAANLRPDAKCLIFERDPAMRRRLKETYSNLEFYSDALDMAEILGSRDETGVDAVVCSLPFANFSREMRIRLARDIQSVLKPNGKLIAVQYSTQMRRMLKALFQDVSISFVPLNIPPAFVYTCIKDPQ